ncbi:hypothetical protein Y032_0731g1906 [Ancylostoma ceylanicum]|uniref:Beta-lactamase-related domain-containing protein n=1 Tax=Ancylostoma ceylanicum TaxID=53326 RepID=A0A016WGV5_9BILA|nr:hypothetical protein Y032_0731g1906 [Ancylostoma ceylanicum]
MAVAFSTTKIWAGLTAAILASRGLLQYDRKVSTFWPEFAKHGKGGISVRDVLDHKAGLVSFGREFGLEDARQHHVISSLIEEAVPLWVPGTTRGYHALTYGFIVDEVIRRLHPQNYSVSQIYNEEIWSEGISFSIGSQHPNHDSIATVSNPPLWESIIAHLKKPLCLLNSIWSHIQHNGLAMISANYPYFLGIMRTDIVPYNDPKILELPLISCMGIGTAEGFAKAVRQVFEKKLISEEVWNLLSRPTTTEEDIVLSSVKSFGHGFTYEQHPVHKGPC